MGRAEGAHVAETTGTETYYRKRANEYDLVYAKPERQDDLRMLEVWLAGVLASRNVLEVATGTGYWTQFYADQAASVIATDINPEVLDVARARRSWPSTVEFVQANGFELAAITGRFDAAFAGFLWSHIGLKQLDLFLAGVVDRVESGSTVVFMDNRYVEGSNHAITSSDPDGNTYQRRALSDGSEWNVLKNFPTPSELRARLGPIGHGIEVTETQYYWSATMITR